MNKIAVLLPVYKNDRPDWVSTAINSIIGQTYNTFTLFIGVDGQVGQELNSTLVSFEENNSIRIIRYSQNRGLACVLNDLLDVAFSEGYEFIARMDADDVSLPTRFEKQMGFLLSHPSVDVVGGAIEEIDEKGTSRGKVIAYPIEHEDCRRFFSRRNPHAHPAVLFHKSFFDKLNGKKYRPEYRQNQDTMLWYDGMKSGTIHANISDVVLRFRITESLFKKRRNGWAFAKKQLIDRKMINKGLGYGLSASLFAYAMFFLLISPAWIKKVAYKVFR